MTGSPGAKPVAPGPICLDPTGVLVPEGEGQREWPCPAADFHEVQVGVTGAGAADLDQHLTRPRFGHRHVAEFARLLPFDELERLDGGASVRDPVEVDHEVSRAAEDLAPPVRRRVDDQPRILDAAQEGLQREVDLQAGQRTAQAGVDAAAPAEVLVVLAFGVELASDRGTASGRGWRRRTPGGPPNPSGMTVPPISMSAVALRLGKNCTADCTRRTSSIAGDQFRPARAAARGTPGLRSSVSTQWAIVLTVES